MEVLTTSITSTTTTHDIEERGYTTISIILMSVISCALFMFLIFFIFYVVSIKYSEYMDSRRLNIQINNYIKTSTQNFNKLYKEKMNYSIIIC